MIITNGPSGMFFREHLLRRKLAEARSRKRCRELERLIDEEAAEESASRAADEAFDKHVKGKLGLGRQ